MVKINYAEFKLYLQNELGTMYGLGYGAGYTRIEDDKEILADVISNRILSMLNKCIESEKEEKDADSCSH